MDIPSSEGSGSQFVPSRTPRKVNVPDLATVEEYRTLFQRNFKKLPPNVTEPKRTKWLNLLNFINEKGNGISVEDIKGRIRDEENLLHEKMRAEAKKKRDEKSIQETGHVRNKTDCRKAKPTGIEKQRKKHEPTPRFTDIHHAREWLFDKSRKVDKRDKKRWEDFYNYAIKPGITEGDVNKVIDEDKKKRAQSCAKSYQRRKDKREEEKKNKPPNRLSWRKPIDRDLWPGIREKDTVEEYKELFLKRYNSDYFCTNTKVKQKEYYTYACEEGRTVEEIREYVKPKRKDGSAAKEQKETEAIASSSNSTKAKSQVARSPNRSASGVTGRRE